MKVVSLDDYRPPKTRADIALAFELRGSHLDSLDETMQQAGILTYRELITNALTLFEWAVAESAKGCRIAAIHETEKRYQPVSMTALSNASRSGEEEK